jgi:hypothetical protein
MFLVHETLVNKIEMKTKNHAQTKNISLLHMVMEFSIFLISMFSLLKKCKKFIKNLNLQMALNLVDRLYIDIFTT